MWRLLNTLKIKLPYDPTIPLLSIYRGKKLSQHTTEIPAHSSLLFTITNYIISICVHWWMDEERKHRGGQLIKIRNDRFCFGSNGRVWPYHWWLYFNMQPFSTSYKSTITLVFPIPVVTVSFLFHKSLGFSLRTCMVDLKSLKDYLCAPTFMISLSICSEIHQRWPIYLLISLLMISLVCNQDLITFHS